jgi:hypothetical protein
MRTRWLMALLGLPILACGGAATSTPTPAGAGGMGDASVVDVSAEAEAAADAADECPALADALHQAVARAIVCEAGVQSLECDAQSPVLDECNCSFPTNRMLSTEAQEARVARQAWVAAGCRPVPSCVGQYCPSPGYEAICIGDVSTGGTCTWPSPL